MNLLERLKERINSYETDSPIIENPAYNYRIMEYVGLIMPKYTIKNFLKLLCFCAFFSSCAYGCLGENSFDYLYLADDVAIIMSTIIGSTATSFLSMRMPIVREIENNLLITTNPDYGKPPKIERFIKSFNLLFIPYLIGIFAVNGVLSVAYFLFHKCQPEEPNCGLVFTAYLFFVDLEKQPWRTIYCMCQIVPSFSCGLGIFIQVLALVSLNELFIVHIKHLNCMLRSISKLPNRSQRKIMIGRCVRYHIFIITNADSVRNKISSFYMFHLILGPTILSVIMYQMLEVAVTFPTFFHFCVYMGLISINCLSGERLLTASMTIEDVAYESIPLDGDTETMKDLMMIMIRSSRPMVITAGKFTIVGHVLLGSILKTTSSVMALLHQM